MFRIRIRIRGGFFGVVDPAPHGFGTSFLDPDPELLFRIQQKIKEQINKNLNSNFGPVNKFFFFIEFKVF